MGVGAQSGRAKKSGGLLTLATVVGLVAAMSLTLLGIGVADKAVAVFDAASWLWSAGKGEIGRVNGVTGKVDTRHKIKDAQGHYMEVTQDDRYVILRDLNTGQGATLDLSTLQVAATTQTTPGLGVRVVFRGDTAFIIATTQGLVRQIDP